MFAIAPPQHGLSKEQRELQEHALEMHGSYFWTPSYHKYSHEANDHALLVLRGQADRGFYPLGEYITRIILVAHDHPDGKY